MPNGGLQLVGVKEPSLSELVHQKNFQDGLLKVVSTAFDKNFERKDFGRDLFVSPNTDGKSILVVARTLKEGNKHSFSFIAVDKNLNSQLVGAVESVIGVQAFKDAVLSVVEPGFGANLSVILSRNFEEIGGGVIVGRFSVELKTAELADFALKERERLWLLVEVHPASLDVPPAIVVVKTWNVDLAKVEVSKLDFVFMEKLSEARKIVSSELAGMQKVFSELEREGSVLFEHVVRGVSTIENLFSEAVKFNSGGNTDRAVSNVKEAVGLALSLKCMVEEAVAAGKVVSGIEVQRLSREQLELIERKASEIPETLSKGKTVEEKSVERLARVFHPGRGVIEEYEASDDEEKNFGRLPLRPLQVLIEKKGDCDELNYLFYVAATQKGFKNFRGLDVGFKVEKPTGIATQEYHAALYWSGEKVWLIDPARDLFEELRSDHLKEDALNYWKKLWEKSGRGKILELTKWREFKASDVTMESIHYTEKGVYYTKYYEGEDKWVKALTAYKNAFRLDKSNIDAKKGIVDSFLKIGEIHYNDQKYVEATKAWREATRIDSNNKLVYRNLARSLENEGKLSEAILACENALKIDSEYAEANLDLGRLFFKTQQYRQAIQFCEKAEKDFPSDVAFYIGTSYYNLGRLEKNEKNRSEYYKKAEEKLMKIEESNRNYVDSLRNLGLICHARGEYDEAVSHFERALKLKPDYEEVLKEKETAFYDKGATLLEKGKYDESIKALEKAIELNPRNAAAHFNIGVAAFKLGNYEKALNAFDEVLKINPSDSRAKEGRRLAEEALKKQEK